MSINRGMDKEDVVHIHNGILLSQSSVNGHLGCFHVLPIVNSAAVNIQVHVSF